jgi:hypothetical protein
MFTVNNVGISRDSFVKRNTLQIFFVAYPLLVSVYYFWYLGYEGDKNARLFFFAVGLPTMAMILLFFLSVTLKSMKTWNNTINGIDFRDDGIFVSSFSVLWMKPKEYLFSPSPLKIRKMDFEWYGKEKKTGVAITGKDGHQFFFVNDYFDDKEEILARLIPN